MRVKNDTTNQSATNRKNHKLPVTHSGMRCAKSWLILFCCIPWHCLQAADIKRDPNQEIAVVNSRKITAADLELEFFLKQLDTDQQQETPAELLEYLIDRELIRQFLEKRKVTADSILLERRMNAVRNLVEGKGDNLDEVLGKLGLTETSLQQMLALQIAWDTYVTTTLTESRIKDFWDENRTKFDGTEVEASQIFKRISGTSNREQLVTELTHQLKQLKEQIESSELSFSAAAQKYSDSPSATKGGDLGKFEYYGTVIEPIAKAAFSNKIGEISQPFSSKYGLHIVHTRSRTDGDLSLEDARPQLVRSMSKVLWDEQVARERKTARIRLLK